MVLIVAKRYSRSRHLAKTIFKLVPHLDPATPNKVPAATNATTRRSRRIGSFRQPHGDFICFRMCEMPTFRRFLTVGFWMAAKTQAIATANLSARPQLHQGRPGGMQLIPWHAYHRRPHEPRVSGADRRSSRCVSAWRLVERRQPERTTPTTTDPQSFLCEAGKAENLPLSMWRSISLPGKLS